MWKQVKATDFHRADDGTNQIVHQQDAYGLIYRPEEKHELLCNVYSIHHLYEKQSDKYMRQSCQKTFSVFFTMVSRRVPLTTLTLTSDVPSTSPAFGFDSTEASPRVQTFSNKVNELETRFKKSSSKRRLLKKNKKKTFAKENFVKKILRGPRGRRMNNNTTLNSSIGKLRWVKIPFVKLILKKKE